MYRRGTMSSKKFKGPDPSVETAKASIYDDEGRTRIPDNIRDKLDLSKGDYIKFVVQGNQTLLYVEEQD